MSDNPTAPRPRITGVTQNLPPVPYENLASADLTLGRVYLGGPQPHVGADPLHYLTGVGNSGGFRPKNVVGTGECALCVLFSTGVVSEWPDGWMNDTTYVYFGDQREPGKDVLDTPRGGNRLLADVATWMKRGERGRKSVPPFLLFEKDSRDRGRDVRFEGVLVPASPDGWLTVEERFRGDASFTNFRAVMKRLPITHASRAWLSDIVRGKANASSAPPPWTRWVETGGSE